MKNYESHTHPDVFHFALDMLISNLHPSKQSHLNSETSQLFRIEYWLLLHRTHNSDAFLRINSFRIIAKMSICP